MPVNKSKSAFRTIAELADELGVATHVLRFWESKFEQIQPMKRAGGRRYYRPDDVALIKAIKSYLYDKRYTIEGVQKLFKEQGMKAILGEEIQRDFFAQSPQKTELDASSREILTHIRTSLSELRDKLTASL
ncbi:MAG: MerR family transcriptional regulator [Alphaproteobacteria bacterium]|nr:MerR family transcriptional regulator [Alphaproteobacteria bacterium]